MKTPTLTLMTVLVLALSGCTGAENKVGLLDEGQQSSINFDNDRDGLPDALEQEVCQRSVTKQIIATAALGACQGGDLDLRDDIQASAFLPTGVTKLEDADGDALPARLMIEGLQLTIDPLSFERVRLEPAAPMFVADVDRDDKDAQVPAPSVVTVSYPIPAAFVVGPDADKDDLPASVAIQFVHLEVDRRVATVGVTLKTSSAYTAIIDAKDNDASEPVTDKVTTQVPSNAWHTGDGDDDGIPASLVMQWLELTVDRTSNAGERLTTRVLESETIIDDNDKDRDNIVPLSTVDADKDLIADEAEPLICMVQRQNDPTDGVCVRADGSGHDGSGQNYVPPHDLSRLLDLVDKTSGEIQVDGLNEASGDSKDAPGASALLLAALMGLVAWVRRR